MNRRQRDSGDSRFAAETCRLVTGNCGMGVSTAGGQKGRICSSTTTWHGIFTCSGCITVPATWS